MNCVENVTFSRELFVFGSLTGAGLTLSKKFNPFGPESCLSFTLNGLARTGVKLSELFSNFSSFSR